jgi:hypothetical protein
MECYKCYKKKEGIFGYLASCGYCRTCGDYTPYMHIHLCKACSIGQNVCWECCEAARPGAKLHNVYENDYEPTKEEIALYPDAKSYREIEREEENKKKDLFSKDGKRGFYATGPNAEKVTGKVFPLDQDF